MVPKVLLLTLAFFSFLCFFVLLVLSFLEKSIQDSYLSQFNVGILVFMGMSSWVLSYISHSSLQTAAQMRSVLAKQFIDREGLTILLLCTLSGLQMVDWCVLAFIMFILSLCNLVMNKTDAVTVTKGFFSKSVVRAFLFVLFQRRIVDGLIIASIGTFTLVMNYARRNENIF